MQWLWESQKTLDWTDELTIAFVKSKYKVSGKGKLTEVLSRLTREQAEDFTNEINKRL